MTNRNVTIANSGVTNSEIYVRDFDCHDSEIRDTKVSVLLSQPEGFSGSIRKSRVTKCRISEGGRIEQSTVSGTAVNIGAHIISSTVKDSNLQHHAHVERSQITGATIQERATVTDSIIHRGVIVEQSARVSNVEIPADIRVPSTAVVRGQDDVEIVRHGGRIYARFTAEGHSFWRHKYVYSTSALDTKTGQIAQEVVQHPENEVKQLFK